MGVEGPGGQGPEKGDLGQTLREKQHQRRETDAATEQRVRGHHERSDELGGIDSRRVTSATGDGQVATTKEETQQPEVVGLC